MRLSSGKQFYQLVYLWLQHVCVINLTSCNRLSFGIVDETVFYGYFFRQQKKYLFFLQISRTHCIRCPMVRDVMCEWLMLTIHLSWSRRRGRRQREQWWTAIGWWPAMLSFLRSCVSNLSLMWPEVSGSNSFSWRWNPSPPLLFSLCLLL